MQVTKSAIIEMLKARGLDDRVAEADKRLPDVLDVGEDGGLLSELGILIDDLGQGGAGSDSTGDVDEAPTDDETTADETPTDETPADGTPTDDEDGADGSPPA